MAFLHDPRREPAINAPASILVLIALLLAAHAVRVFSPPATSDAILNLLALVPAAYTDPHATLLDKIVPPLGHMFAHANWMHVGFNSIWLLAFGPAAARRYGVLGFYIFFALCGLAGAAGFVFWNWGQYVGAIGASGAISGVMAASFRMLPRIGQPRGPLAPLLSPPILGFAVVWLVLNVVTAYLQLGTFGTVEAVAWQAHMGGFLAGLLLAGPFDRIFGAARA
jgi:membrane associated rhomboid family serine protease